MALEVRKTASPESGPAPLDVTFAIVVTNRGSVTLTSVVVRDLGIGLSETTCAPSLAPGQRCSVPASARYDKPGSYPNFAEACGSFDGRQACAQGLARVTVRPAANS